MDSHPERERTHKTAPDIADVSGLFEEPPVQSDTTQPAPPEGFDEDGGHYEVEEVDVPVKARYVPIAPGDDVGSAPQSKQTRSNETVRPPAPELPHGKLSPSERRPRLDPSATVEEVWTRGAEWGSTILMLAAVATGLLVLLYALISIEQYFFAFLMLIAGGLALAVLSYPILITLERPVRITPEQAVTDYFGALSHHSPHLKRMWLLLSASGKVTSSFGSFEGFKAYWIARLNEIKAGRASPLTPLKFQVVEFRCEKSAGKSEVEADYTVEVLVRGRTQEGPIEKFRVKSTLVKGPDKMWYLDRGTLP